MDGLGKPAHATACESEGNLGLLQVIESHWLGCGRWGTSLGSLVISLFGLLLARIRLLVVMLGLGWFVLVVPPLLFPPLSLLSVRSFSGWARY